MGSEVQEKLREVGQLLELLEFVSEGARPQQEELSTAPWGGMKLTLTRCRALVNELEEDFSGQRTSASLSSRMTQVPRRNSGGHVREIRTEFEDGNLLTKPESS